MDVYTDALSTNVPYMRKKLRLLSHLDMRDAYDCIPLVKVRRKEDCTFELDPTFMAPSELLDTVVSSRYVVIPLTFDKEQGSYLQGKVDATLLDQKAGLYLAVTANMPALNLVAEVPRQLKIASPHDIEALIRSALPGLQLVHMAQVPMEVPVRPNAYYFSIDHRGELYEAMMKALAIAIYAPGTFTELRMELFAITD